MGDEMMSTSLSPIELDAIEWLRQQGGAVLITRVPEKTEFDMMLPLDWGTGYARSGV